MNKFSKSIILFVFCACACVAPLFAETLPGSLDDAQPLDMAWEVKSIPGAADPLFVYLAFGDSKFLPDWLRLPPPPTKGEGDYLSIEVSGSHYSTFSQEHRDESFSHQWNICVYSQSGAQCVLSVKRLVGELPAGSSLKLYQADGSTMIEDLSSATATSAVSVTIAPGKYVIQYMPPPPPSVFTVEQTIALKAGWNLISVPYTRLTSATINDESVMETGINFLQNGAFVQETLSTLQAGTAGWIYSATPAELVLSGECGVGTKSEFPQYSSVSWNYLGLIGKCDDAGRLVPADNLPGGAEKWNATTQRYDAASGLPAFCEGYLLK